LTALLLEKLGFLEDEANRAFDLYKEIFQQNPGFTYPQTRKTTLCIFQEIRSYLVLILGVFWGMFQGSEVDKFLNFEALQLSEHENRWQVFQSNPSNKAFQSHKKVGKVRKFPQNLRWAPYIPVITGLVYNSN